MDVICLEKDVTVETGYVRLTESQSENFTRPSNGSNQFTNSNEQCNKNKQNKKVDRGVSVLNTLEDLSL